jgi:hypothetical protein
MVFEHLYCLFGCIASIHVWRDELVLVNAFFVNGALECFGCFVVEFLQARLEAAFDNILVHFILGLEEFGVRVIAHGSSKDGDIAVVVIKG